MTPRQSYKLYDPVAEENEVDWFIASYWSGEVPHLPLEFPTVIARDLGGDICGVLGTHYIDEFFIAGPLVLPPVGNHAATALHLMKAYELVLRLAGVTTYMFGVAYENERFNKLANKVGAQLVGQNSGRYWYLREVA